MYLMLLKIIKTKNNNFRLASPHFYPFLLQQNIPPSVTMMPCKAWPSVTVAMSPSSCGATKTSPRPPRQRRVCRKKDSFGGATCPKNTVKNGKNWWTCLKLWHLLVFWPTPTYHGEHAGLFWGWTNQNHDLTHKNRGTKPAINTTNYIYPANNWEDCAFRYSKFRGYLPYITRFSNLPVPGIHIHVAEKIAWYRAAQTHSSEGSVLHPRASHPADLQSFPKWLRCRPGQGPKQRPQKMDIGYRFGYLWVI